MEERICERDKLCFKSGVKGWWSDRWWEQMWWLWWGDMCTMEWIGRRVNRMRLTEWRRQLIITKWFLLLLIVFSTLCPTCACVHTLNGFQKTKEHLYICALRFSVIIMNDNINANVYSAVIMARPLQEFTWFIRWMQTKHQASSNPQSKPINLACESACRLPPSTPTVAIYYYYSARSLALILKVPQRVEGWVMYTV